MTLWLGHNNGCMCVHFSALHEMPRPFIPPTASMSVWLDVHMATEKLSFAACCETFIYEWGIYKSYIFFIMKTHNSTSPWCFECSIVMKTVCVLYRKTVALTANRNPKLTAILRAREPTYTASSVSDTIGVIFPISKNVYWLTRFGRSLPIFI